MPELISKEKIQPGVLDRLTDLAPGHTEEAMHERVLSLSRYREGVLRDLRWLLGASRHGDGEDLQAYPEVRTSTLNYGVRSLCGRLAVGVREDELQREIAAAIEMFEPRVLPGSLTVVIKKLATTEARNELSLEIRGELWARPIPEEFLLRTEVDLETGEMKTL